MTRWDALWHRCLLLVVACSFCSWSVPDGECSSGSGAAAATLLLCLPGHVQPGLFVHSFSVSSLSSISSGRKSSANGPFAYLPAYNGAQRRIHAPHGSMQQHPSSASALRSSGSSSSDNDDNTTPPSIDLTSYATPKELSDSGQFEAADLRAELRRVGLRSDDIPTTADVNNDAAEVLELSKRLFTTKYMRVEDLPSDLLLDSAEKSDSNGQEDDDEESDTASPPDSSASSTPDAAAVGVAAKIGLGLLQNSQGGMSNPFAKKESADTSSTTGSNSSNPFATGKQSANSNNPFNKVPGSSGPGAGGNASSNPFASKPASGVSNPSNPFAKKEGSSSNPFTNSNPWGKDAEEKNVVSPFGAGPSTDAGANPFAKAKQADSPPPVNPFAATRGAGDDTSKLDETAETDKKNISPFGAESSAGATSNPFAKKEGSSSNPFAGKNPFGDSGATKSSFNPFASKPTLDSKSDDIATEDSKKSLKIDDQNNEPGDDNDKENSDDTEEAAEGNRIAAELKATEEKARQVKLEAEKVKAKILASQSAEGTTAQPTNPFASSTPASTAPSTTAVNPFAAKKVDSSPANPFAKKPSEADDNSDYAKDDTARSAADVKQSSSPFGAGPSTGATANPFAAKKVDSSPANPFAKKPSEADDNSDDAKDDTAGVKQSSSPFGAGPSTGATANPFVKKVDSPPANPFASASSPPPKPSSPFGSPASNPFGVAPKASDGPEVKSSSSFGSPPPTSTAASNPFGGPPKTPVAPSGDTGQSANPFVATPPTTGLGASASGSPPIPASNTPPAAQDTKSEDPFAFFAAPPPTMEEVADFVDPFGKEKAPEAAPPAAEDPSAAQISQRLAAERREAERLDAELAAAEVKEAQQATQRQQSATPTDQGNEEEEEEYEEEIDIEITPDTIDQIRSWDPVSLSWRVGARHFMSNDDFRSLSSPVEMGYGHGFFLRLHLQGPRAGVELRIGDITADLVLRNMEIFLHCRDQFGQRIVAHAAALENGSCASEDDPNSFGCCPFVYENDDGVMMEVSRQMLYQQAKGGGLRIEGYFEVGAVGSFR